jgi:hypothetical protein
MTNIIIGLGADRTIEVDRAKFTPEVAEHIFMYGLRQILNDAHASEKDGAAKTALSEKRLAKLYEGQINRGGNGAKASADPVEKEATRLAKAIISKIDKSRLEAAAKRRAIEVDDLKLELIAAYAAKPETIAQARANVSAMNAVEIEL